MKSKKIIYRIAVLLSAFFVLNCGGLSTTNGGGHGGGNNNPPKVEKPKVACAKQGLSADSTGACFKAEATPANLQELVDLIDKKYKTDPNADLNKIDVSKVAKLTCLFAATNCKDATTKKRPTELGTKDFHTFNGKIDKWNTNSVISMQSMFYDNSNFNGDLSHWDVSNVKDMSGMFAYALNFTGDLSKWKVGKVENMNGMFVFASKFNSDISGWNVSNVTNMGGMFSGASRFNQNIDKWNVRKVLNIDGMFNDSSNPGAMSFPLPSWGSKFPANVSKKGVFASCPVARTGLPSWCTGSCI